jgi:dihydrofolate reductase
MRKLRVFNSISLDGYFTDTKGDMSWAHKYDPEWNAFTSENAQGGRGPLLFGRVTYEMMASFWPTPAAMEQMPEVAEGMNRLPKIVFSRTLENVTWANTRLVKTGLIEEVKKMKVESDDDMLIMGSGTIISQLSQHDLIDEYQVVVNPIVLGTGRTMFEGLEKRLNLKRTSSRTFANGNVFLCYELVK